MGYFENVAIEFLATFLIWFLYVGLIILWFIDGRIKKEEVIHAVLASLIAWILAYLIKRFFPTIRPFMLNGKGVDVLIKPTDGAFPSAHTALAFALGVTVFMHDRKIGCLFLVGAIFVGISRVMANVHYPSDILGGTLIGTLVAVLMEHVHLFGFLHKKVRP
jgi:undecaprenyl-diphosphatase